MCLFYLLMIAFSKDSLLNVIYMSMKKLITLFAVILLENILKKIYILVSLVLFSSVLLSQTYNMTDGTTVSTCMGTFYDSGGTSNYSVNEDLTMTFCSDDGNPIQIDFTAWDVRNGCEFVVGNILLEDVDIDCIQVPNAFTPNGDGVNDTFII